MLLLWETGVEYHWETLGNSANAAQILCHLKGEGAGVFIHQLQSLRVASGSYEFPSTLGLSPRQNDFLNDREHLEDSRNVLEE